MKPVCSECENCQPIEWSRRLRAFNCTHPKANDGSARFSVNLIGGRVDVYSAFADRPTIMTSPKWCPKLKDHSAQMPGDQPEVIP